MRWLVFFSSVISIFLPVSIFAQPETAWIRTYNSNSYDNFEDIYKVAGSGYIMCGYAGFEGGSNDETSEILIVRIDDEGNEVWSGTYGYENTCDFANSIIETDRGDFVAAGVGNGEIAAVMVDADGGEVWLESFDGDRCNAVIELKNSDFLLAGVSGDLGRLICINYDGDVIWETEYESGTFTSMRETDGGVVICGWETFNERQSIEIWVVKVDHEQEGELLWSHYLAPENCQVSYSMTSTNDGSFALGSTFWTGNGENDEHIGLTFIDDEGNLSSYTEYDLNLPGCYCQCIERLDEGFILVGHSVYRRPYVQPVAIRINNNGDVRWTNVYQLRNLEGFGSGSNSFRSVVFGHDNSIVAAGRITTRNNVNIRDGVVVKLEPDILGPQFISWEPEDTMLTVLFGDTVDFMVRAFDAQGDNLGYTWMLDDDLIAENDTTVTVVFDRDTELHEVKCEVTDGEFISSITWHVDVREWYIAGFDPDSLNLKVLRGDAVDFGLDVRVLEDIDLNYQWYHTDVEGRYDEGNEETSGITFDLSGAHLVEGIVSGGDEIQSISWNVNAMGFVVRSFEPDSLLLRIRRNSQVNFSLNVEALDNVDVEYRWIMSGRDQQWEMGDESFIDILFDQSGDYEIEVYIAFEGQTESVAWSVDVLSSIWSWYPEELTMTVPKDTSMFFHLEAYNPASDSLSYKWCLNGDPINADSTIAELSIDFPEVRICEIQGILQDGMDADTVRWEIEVFDPADVGKPSVLLPESITLSPPFPNPFNSRTKISLSLPVTNEISLKVFDLEGRHVSTLADGRIAAGYHIIEFDAGEYPAGLYLLKLKVGNEVINRKAVVLR